MVVWMGVVFLASTELGAESNTSRILVPLLRWFDPQISAAAIDTAHLIVRKTAHVTEYGILAVLVLRTLRLLRVPPLVGWSWPVALWALCASAVYASTDEIHQLFVATRGPSVHDVLIDSCGAAFGLLLAFWWMRHDRARRQGERG